MREPLANIRDSLTPAPRCGKTHIILIDGRAGSGKTTFAQGLCAYLSRDRKVEVLHLDEIYSGWTGALGENLGSSLSRILEDLSAGRNPRIQVFNWAKKAFTSERTIPDCDVLIIEGVGSGQRSVRKSSAILIWLEIDATKGLARVLERDGNQIQAEMSEWQISEEEHYLREFTKENSDFIFSTDV